MNVVNYFTVNIRATVLKIPTNWTEITMLTGVAAAFLFIFFSQFLTNDTFKENKTSEEFT